MPMHRQPISGSLDILHKCLRDHFPGDERRGTAIDLGCGRDLHAVPRIMEKMYGCIAVDQIPEKLIERENLTPGVTYTDLGIFAIADRQWNPYRFIHCSHVIEHLADTGCFLSILRGLAHDDGSSVFCLIWPKPKSEVVGGHLHTFNMGQMLYNLVASGIDCRDVHMVERGYSLGIYGNLFKFDVPSLANDIGDIETLSEWFPFHAEQGFDGDRCPGVKSL